MILGTYTLNPPIDQLKDAEFGRDRPSLTAQSSRSTRLGRSTASGRPLLFCTTGRSPRSTPSSAKRPIGPRRSAWASTSTPEGGRGRTPFSSSLPKLDTTLPGNSNVGHEFGASLSEDERKWLIEYLKTL